MAFFKTILAVLFRTFGLTPRFLSVKPSFLYDHLTTQHSDFSIFLGICLTDKPVDRNASACTYLSSFSLRGFNLSGYSHKTNEDFEHFGLQNAKNIWLENLLGSAPLAPNYTNRISSQKMAQEV